MSVYHDFAKRKVVSMKQRLKRLILKRFSKNYWQSGISSKWHKMRREKYHDDFERFAGASYLLINREIQGNDHAENKTEK